MIGIIIRQNGYNYGWPLRQSLTIIWVWRMFERLLLGHLRADWDQTWWEGGGHLRTAQLMQITKGWQKTACIVHSSQWESGLQPHWQGASKKKWKCLRVEPPASQQGRRKLLPCSCWPWPLNLTSDIDLDDLYLWPCFLIVFLVHFELDLHLLTWPWSWWPWPVTLLAEKHYFVWHWILTYDLDLQSHPSWGQGQPPCHKSRSYVKRFSSKSTHRHTYGLRRHSYVWKILVNLKIIVTVWPIQILVNL